MAKRESKAVAVQGDRPSYLPATTGPGRGSEEVRFNDVVVPRLSIIQSLSPQRKKNDEQYIDGAEEGMFFNTVTRKLYDGNTGVYVCPVYFRPEWVIWKKRTEGGGFVGAYASQGEAAQAYSQQPNQQALELLDTAQHFCLIFTSPESEEMEEVVISMAKSQLKASRNLNSLAKIAGGDRFSRVYHLTTVQVDGPKGEYFNWKFDALGFAPEHVYRRAEQMYESVKSGAKTVDRGVEDTHAEVDDKDL